MNDNNSDTEKYFHEQVLLEIGVSQGGSLQMWRDYSGAKTVDSLHYYNSVIVIEKKLEEEPVRGNTGKMSFPDLSKLYDFKLCGFR